MNLILSSDTHYGMDGKTHAKHEAYWNDVSKTIQKHQVKAFIWAGDLAANKQRNLVRSLEHARQHIDIPILLVRGNHDFWDTPDKYQQSSRRSFQVLDALHKEAFAKYNIVHLEQGPHVIDDVIFCGWDGWYSVPPNTNDAKNMFRDVNGSPMHVFMSHRASKKFEEVLSIDTDKYRTAVAVTHFNPYCTETKWIDMCANPKFYDMVKEKFDVFCCGHNHQFKYRLEDGCLVLNSGSMYNDPKFILFEI